MSQCRQQQLAWSLYVRGLQQSRQQRRRRRAAARVAPGIQIRRRAADPHAAGIDFDKAPAGLERQFYTRFQHRLQPAAQVYLPARFDELPRADLDVLIHRHREVVVCPCLDFAVGVDGVVFLGLEFAVGVLLDGVVAFVADADLLVVLDVFVPIALGVQEDLFRAFFVFDAQFVEATAAR